MAASAYTVRGPNFFIIGAPKCGTTSLFAWLLAHPNVFLPRCKEPHYFNDDHRNRRVCCESDYLKLYRNCEPAHTAVGDASVWYLYSNNAVKNILAYNDTARIIVCLRNPIDMALSLHNHLLFIGHETIRDFEEAWKAQADRARGRRIPRFCQEPAFLQYRAVCSLGTQLKRLYESVRRDAVLTVVLDDLVRDARSEYQRVLRFLGLPDDMRGTFPIANAARRRRSYVLQGGVRAGRAVKEALGIAAGSWLLNRIDQANKRPGRRKEVDARVAKAIDGQFEEDVALLSKLLSRDLSYWLKRK